MRIRRSILAPIVLTVGTVGSLAVAPTMAILSSTAPAATAVAASSPSPNIFVYHG